jgi:copper chaperone CopZ
MKKVSVMIMSIFVLFISCTYTQNVKKEEIKIKVGFHCPNGKALLEKELIKLDGVYEVKADVETKLVSILYDKKKQNKETLVAAIEKIGYTTEFTEKGKEINKACSHD